MPLQGFFGTPGGGARPLAALLSQHGRPEASGLLHHPVPAHPAPEREHVSRRSGEFGRWVDLPKFGRIFAVVSPVFNPWLGWVAAGAEPRWNFGVDFSFLGIYPGVLVARVASDLFQEQLSWRQGEAEASLIPAWRLRGFILDAEHSVGWEVGIPQLQGSFLCSWPCFSSSAPQKSLRVFPGPSKGQGS